MTQKQDRKTFNLIIAPCLYLLSLFSKPNCCTKGGQHGAPSLVLHCWKSASKARLCSRRALSGCTWMCSGCPCLGHSLHKLHPPDVYPVVLAKACTLTDNQNGTKRWAFKLVHRLSCSPVKPIRAEDSQFS